MDKPKRYSDDVPYEKRRYWYFTLHGLGPGTIPTDLHILETREGKNDKGTLGLYICLDGILNTSELKDYDLRELAPTEEKTEIKAIMEYLNDEGWSGMSEIWEENNEIHIYIKDGDWKHSHLWLKILMEKLGYIQTEEKDEPSDSDSYTAEHVYVKF